MEKLVYILWPQAGMAAADLRAHLLGGGAKQLRECGARKIAVNVNDEDVAQGEGIRIRKTEPPICALVTFWMDNSDDRGPCEDVLRGCSSRIAGYLVVESVPIVNTTQVVPPGERIPGSALVGCISKLPDMPYDEWLRYWSDVHKVVAIETQSTFSYIRNVVVRALTADAPAWDGIVEEGFPIEALTDPKVFYDAGGSEEVYQRNLKRMVDSCNLFLDFGPLESHPMSRYLLDD